MNATVETDSLTKDELMAASKEIRDRFKTVLRPDDLVGVVADAFITEATRYLARLMYKTCSRLTPKELQQLITEWMKEFELEVKINYAALDIDAKQRKQK